MRNGARARGWLVVASLTLTAMRAEELDSPVARGRAVYIAEGCIHCHSQFVRPGGVDEVRWGPAPALADVLAERPPLPGNRRQGPDLTNVGNRRSADWLRLQLIEPRAVAPGSRMPGYGHLFRAGDERGDALVTYLLSLGADTVRARRAQVVVWRPGQPALDAGGAAAPERGARMFAALCAGCHGAAGHGDGPLATRIGDAPTNFSGNLWRQVRADDPERLVTIARLVKFGVPGTPMAGHEFLGDADTVALARTVETLRQRGETGK